MQVEKRAGDDVYQEVFEPTIIWMNTLDSWLMTFSEVNDFG